MRVWRVTASGEPADVLHRDEVPDPQPAPGEVIVDVAAAAVNFPDLLLCRGTYHHKPDRPFGLGCEATGVVSAVGAGVTHVHPGQRVITAPMSYGCFADRVRTRSAAVLPIPDMLPDAEAAALFMAYQTSWVGLTRRAGLSSGQTLLVFGAAGGVGSAAVQLGKALGARVIAVAGGEAKTAACHALGADLVIDHHTQDVTATVREYTAGRGADVIYDPVGGSAFETGRRCIALEGRILVVGFAAGTIPTLAVNHALMKNYSVVGFRLQPFREDPVYVREVHDRLLALYSAGAVRPLIGEVLPMAAAPAAVARLDGRTVLGRVVLTG